MCFVFSFFGGIVIVDNGDDMMVGVFGARCTKREGDSLNHSLTHSLTNERMSERTELTHSLTNERMSE